MTSPHDDVAEQLEKIHSYQGRCSPVITLFIGMNITLQHCLYRLAIYSRDHWLDNNFTTQLLHVVALVCDMQTKARVHSASMNPLQNADEWR